MPEKKTPKTAEVEAAPEDERPLVRLIKGARPLRFVRVEGGRRTIELPKNQAAPFHHAEGVRITRAARRHYELVGSSD